MKRAVVFLKKGEGRTVRSGGAWIYDNEIALVEGDIEPGDLVDVFGSSDNPQRSSYFLGTGFYNATPRFKQSWSASGMTTISSAPVQPGSRQLSG